MIDGKGHRTCLRHGCKHESGAGPGLASPTPRSGEAGPQAPPPYFTHSRNTVDKGEGELVEVETEYEVVAVGCKSRFCPQCCKSLGIKLREVITPVLKTFQGMLMLTLTVDPKLFANPEQAYRYVREKRCVAELVRALHKAGHLHSRRFFYVVEWQKNTEMAHFHLLVESDFIPFEKLCEYWGRFRPASAGPPVGDAPAFGHVRFSKAKFHTPEYAANYACKYLTKLPQQGFPDWVLSFKGQIRLFATSRNLIPQKPRPKKPFEPKLHEGARPHRDTCFCDRCRGETPADQVPEGEKQRTVGERLKRCGQRAALIGVPLMMKPDGELVDGKPYFVEILPLGFRETKEFLQVDDQGRRFRLRPGERDRLAKLHDRIREPREWVASAVLERVQHRRIVGIDDQVAGSPSRA